MKFKKLQMTVAALLLGTTVTYASSEIYLLGGSTDIGASDTMTTYGFGYGGSNSDPSKDTQILYGINIEFLAASTKMHSTQAATNILLKAGYRHKRLSMYVLGGLLYDGYTGTSSIGLGYGGSVEFDLWRSDVSSKSIAIGAEYLSASMKNAQDYKYTSDNITGFLKYKW